MRDCRNRRPSPATLEAAMTACVALGGHLASPRDLTEAIRAGLPNGTGGRLQTWDLGSGDTALPRLMVTSWMGVGAGFTDQYPRDMTWQPVGTSLPFRCVWTNELR
jgi:hypothetical protein